MPRNALDRRLIVNMMVLPGQPTDGSGRVCIHLFVPDEKGRFVEPHVMCENEDQSSPEKVIAKSVRGRLACSSTRSAVPKKLPQTKLNGRGVVEITHRSDDPRAVTCPKCIASEYYKSITDRLHTG